MCEVYANSNENDQILINTLSKAKEINNNNNNNK